ncbi:acyltransferase family protein [Nocardioides aequoreus]|uniref:acyltransferase family protein n=1 Tax=Nocardioides aequoreus TaxID=397278 RepID=UPI0006920612|nr:acyltransferase family protein [Nocardioides aequoreus]
MPPSEAAPGYRPDIQGLRAVAVLLVLGYHLSPARLTGGFVGVDVFFVISGYLITGQLYRELATTGRISLTRFWERRARRLLPAALLVLAVCTALTAVVVPTTQWDQTLRQIVASALYWQNWALASDAVAYSAQGNTATVVQHYWSLSVEEQFYVGWPILVLLVAWALRHRGPAVRRRGLLALLTVVTLVSFAWSVSLTRTDPDAAYFVTQTRVWEFSVGALLAVVLAGAGRTDAAAHRRAGWVLGWVGAGAVAASALLLDESSAFPGWIALLPVLGTAAVLAVGGLDAPGSVGRALRIRPARFLGDISYAVYLWHWPLIVAVPLVTGASLSRWDKGGVLLATLLLAWLSTRYVEQPVRVRRSRPGRRWQALVVTAAAMALVAGAAVQLQLSLDRQVAAERARAAEALSDPGVTGCLGPPALDPDNGCETPTGSGPLLVSPEVTSRQNTQEAFLGCQGDQDRRVVVSCTLGEREDPVRTVALVGDSHATMWFPALDRLGRERGWRIRTYSRSSCPFTEAVRLLPASEATPAKQEVCAWANERVSKRLVGDPEVDTVFVAAFSSAYQWRLDARREGPGAAEAGFRRAWAPLVQAGKQVVALRDVPVVKERVNTPDCLLASSGDPMACALPRGEALLPDAEATAASVDAKGCT